MKNLYKRNVIFSVRFSEHESVALRRLAFNRGISGGAFLRALFRSYPPALALLKNHD